MNMPFEYGIDVGLRRCGDRFYSDKKFLIFEKNRFDFKKALSDIAGQDVAAHENNFEIIIGEVRNFFRVEAGIDIPGRARLLGEYATFQGWMTEKKIDEGHSEDEATALPTRERLDEMQNWLRLGKPAKFVPPRDTG